MELDDFKTGLGPVTGPSEKENGNGISSLMDEIKANDEILRKRIMLFLGMNIALFSIYAASFAAKSGGLRMGYSFLVLGFALIVAYFLFRYLRLKNINYTAPVKDFLLAAKRRYAYMTLWDWVVIIPLLAIVGTGGFLVVWFSFSKYFPKPYLAAIIYLILFGSAIGIGFWSSKKQWIRESGDRLRCIREMLREMEEHSS